MIASRHLAAVLAMIACLVCGCEQPPPLPPPDLEKRGEMLIEVKKQLAALRTAAPAEAASLLEHGDPRVRARAARRLGDLGAASSAQIPNLLKHTKDKDRYVRIEVALALGLIRDSRGVDPLIKMLTDPDRKVRLWAGKGLRKIGESAIPKMISHLANTSPFKALSYKDEAGIDHFIREIIRQQLVIFGKVAVPYVIEGLEQEDWRTRSNSITTLGDMGPIAKPGIKPLLEIVSSNKDDTLRRYAIISLKKIGDLDPDITPILTEATKDPDKRIAREAKSALDHFRKVAAAKKKKK